MDAEEGKADEAIDQVMFKKRMVFVIKIVLTYCEKIF